MAGHNNGIALVFARTETRWFQTYVFNGASALLFVAGRIHFHHLDGTRATGAAGGPSVLAAYGNRDRDILGACEIKGKHLVP